VAKNNNYIGTSATVGFENTSYDNVLFQPTKPVLDSELNFISDLQSSKLQDFVRSKIPSGWLDANFKMGLDNTSNLFGINLTTEPNTFVLNSKKQSPMIANVNGWLLNIGGTNIASDNKIKITLPEPSSTGSRTDLVFLEVFKVQLRGNLATHKPSETKIFKFGNTQYGGSNPDDSIINPSIGIETTQRVQIQYRLRIVTGVDFETYPEGVDDENAVLAQGAKSTTVANYFYRNAGTSFDDYGLYISGNGSASSRLDLGTVDGYCYAIPMFKIHRRNTSAFTSSNQNGSGFKLGTALISDRPDGLFSDQIDAQDIEDLRHIVSFSSFNYQEMLDKSLEDLYAGELSTCLHNSGLDSNLRRGNLGLYIQNISDSVLANVDLITRGNNLQRYFSDVAGVQKYEASFMVSNKSSGVVGDDWVATDQIQLSLPSFNGRATAVISNTTPNIFFIDGVSGDVISVNGSWSNLGTPVATFTFGSNSSLTDQKLYISYEISYSRRGDKLRKPISRMLRVEDRRNNNESWGFISVNDFDSTVITNQRRRERVVTPRQVRTGVFDYAFVYRADREFNNNGIGTLYSYHFLADGSSQQVTIPRTLINVNDVAYVFSCYNVDLGRYIKLEGVQRNVSGDLVVNLPQAVSALLRFDVALKGGVIQYDERTSSVVEIAKTSTLRINGNGTNTVYLKNTLSGDVDDIVIGAQSEYRELSENLFVVANTCYVNNIRTYVQIIIVPNSSIIKLVFNETQPPAVGSEIRIDILHHYSPKDTDSLSLYYEYYEYKGVASRTNFGNTASSFIDSKVVFHRNKLDIVTNGTGAINTSEFLSKKFEPLLPKLPRPNDLDTGDFLGTEHKSKLVIGGSYSLNTEYSSPYASGESNFLSKEESTQILGTDKGGLFVSAAEPGEDSIHKLIVAGLLEVVKEDGTNNFKPGELTLKVETNYLINTTDNRITNSTVGLQKNSFDVFKLEGRPLIKLNSK
jgi:hypothetical protein